MKRFISFFLTVLLILSALTSLSACSDNDSEDTTTTTEQTTTEETTTIETTTDQPKSLDDPEILTTTDSGNTLAIHNFEKESARTINYKYSVLLPDGYDENDDKEWPLIMFLHGGAGFAGKNGYDEKSAISSFSNFEGLPAVIVRPVRFLKKEDDDSGPKKINKWDPVTLKELTDKVSEEYKIDKSKRTLTGHSGGASAAWEIAWFYPNLFSKIAIFGSSTTPYILFSVPRKLPIWMFIGTKDPFYIQQKQGAEAAIQFGKDLVLTEFPNAYHGEVHGKALKLQTVRDWLTSDEDLRTENP